MTNILWFTWKDREHPLAGGAEVVTQKLIEGLISDGHTVECIVGGFKKKVEGQKLKVKSEKYVEKNGYKITRLGNRYTVYALAIFYYFKHLRKKNYDIVIDEVNTAPFFASWYMRNKNVKHFLFFHQLAREIWFYQMPWFIGWIGYLGEAVYLRLLSIGSPQVITVSESTKQDLMKYGFRKENINIISEGLDDDGASIKPIELESEKYKVENIKYKRPTILSFGAVRAMKRTLEIVKAFEILKASGATPSIKESDDLSSRKLSRGFSEKELADLRLIIAGDTNDSYARKMIKYIEKSPFKKDIEVLGRVTAEKKKELMQKSQIIAVTSIKEGWGLIVTEANSQGTPAVVYDVDGLRDAVKHDETGLVCQPTPANLAKGIAQLLQDKEKYDKLRTNAWKWSKEITFERCYGDFKKSIM